MQVNNKINVQLWQHLLKDYDDIQVIDFMRFGWPSGFIGEDIPALDIENHPSSKKHPEQIKDYLDKEISCNAMMGPYSTSPFIWTRTNPLMVRPKKEENKYRVILDLSHPIDRSVNSHIPRFVYDGGAYKLKLPTALDMAEIIAKLGKNLPFQTGPCPRIQTIAL